MESGVALAQRRDLLPRLVGTGQSSTLPNPARRRVRTRRPDTMRRPGSEPRRYVPVPMTAAHGESERGNYLNIHDNTTK